MRKSLLILPLVLAGLAFTHSAKADTCNGITANLVSNCGFESGTFTGWSGTSTTDAFSGIDTGDPSAIGKTPFSGIYEAFLGSFGDEILTQSLTTIPGLTYTVEFALLNDTPGGLGYPNDFTATFGTTTLFTETNAAVGPYKLYTGNVKATSTSTPLTFTSQNATGDFELDSISVAATPEPGSLLLLGTGLIGVFTIARRRFVL